MAIVRSDYGSSAIAFAGCDGTLLAPSWIDSGSVAPLLVTAVTADVVLLPAPGGIGWLDRSVDVLTVAMPSAAPPTFTQLDVRLNVDGIAANPHDVVWLPDGRTLVTRYGAGPALDGSVANDDVLVLCGDAVEEHVVFDARSTGVGSDGRAVTIYARPDQIVVLGDPAAVAVVSLGRTSLDYTAFGEGMVGVIPTDLPVSPVSTLALDGFVNCGLLSRDRFDPTRAYLLCIGPLLEPAESRRESAGVVELELVDGAVVVREAHHIPEPFRVGTGGLVALGGRRVLVVATGSAGETEIPDQLLEVDMAGGVVRQVLEARTGFVLGSGALMPATGEVFVPDADANALLVLDAATASLVRTVPLDSCVGLPPRQVEVLN